MSLISKIISMLKSNWLVVALLCVMMVYIFIAELRLKEKDNALLKCEKNYISLNSKHENLTKELEFEKNNYKEKKIYVDRVVEKNIIEYKDKIVEVEKYVENENLTKCENALNLYRSRYPL